MLTSIKIKYIPLILLIFSCQSKALKLDIKAKNLSLTNGIMLYKDKPYTGVLYSKNDTITLYRVSYLKGIKHGKEERFYFDGLPASQRFYTNGKKVGVHKGWWSNQQPKFITHFDNAGNLTSTQREWLSNGMLIKELHFANGNEKGWQKSWDINGKIKSNYVVINGERFGLIGYNKCKSGDYVD